MDPTSNPHIPVQNHPNHRKRDTPHHDLLELLESEMKTLALDAQTIIAQQSRATQLKLTTETRQLFNNYKQFGSMARLKVGLDKFLSQGDEDGKIQFTKRTPDLKSQIPQQQEDDDDDDDETDNPELPHYGATFMLDLTSNDDKPFQAPTKSTPVNPLLTVDPDSTPYVTTLPWDPIATQITWTRFQSWQRGRGNGSGGLKMINKILSIVDHECRERLFHHVCTYGPSPVFRAGIVARARTNYGTMFETANENYLGLTPESRTFLRDVYDKHSDLNSAETRLLARVCRIGRDSVDLWWEHLATERKPFAAMKIFVMAREIEKGRRAKEREKKKQQQQQEKQGGMGGGAARKE
ncbi:hypothetical protein B0A52_08669 [Exophiala mesophila]|uniref:Uncharacterized protein n=1 Tax=Exophiala mesophila TaxID=212818 RepID=A0A438MWN9_EXOME|nr:hypothetical protein B0A52_08669 [Exophiala mesophila]